MPTIGDLVAAIRRRDGVDAAVVLGRDGLLIDHQSEAGPDAESIAAHVPSILVHADELAAAAGQGHLDPRQRWIDGSPDARDPPIPAETRLHRGGP